MKERYLWDRSGPPDADIENLERVLEPLRYSAQPLRPARIRGRAARPVWLAAAAALVLAAAGLHRLAPPSPGATPWQVARFEGEARLGARKAAVSMPVRAGQTVRTGGASELTLQAEDVGRLDLGPDSQLRASGGRLVLDRGVLHALIWAPPRRFVLDTPSSRAVDLGCEYKITVNPSGDGLLRVATGWVAFQFRGRESFIPAGAECATRRGKGPGVPYYANAPESLRAAIGEYEKGDRAALGRILEAAGPRDGLTLWHLLTAAPAEDRGPVFDRFAQLIPPPPGVRREAVIRNEPRALDLCWDALSLENTGWWRGWERRWSE